MAQIVRFPRYKGQRAEDIDPAKIKAFDDALDELAAIHEQWRDFMAQYLSDGPFIRDDSLGGTTDHIALHIEDAQKLLGQLDVSAANMRHMAAICRQTPDE